MRIERFACRTGYIWPGVSYLTNLLYNPFGAPPFAALCSAPDREYVEAALIWHIPMIPKREQRDWRELARQAAGEQDPKKLLEIIEELNAVLEEREKQLRSRFAKPIAPSISPQEASDKRLLFVDDEPNIRLTLPPLIEQYGFKVKSAGSVAEALGLIKSDKFDALLCDINIDQEGDGFTVVQAMREAAPDCVTVLLTGYPGFETALKAVHSEVDDYVVKPADIGILVSTLERKLSARRMRRGD
jgi:ActR/RegA family two-component response regulator